MKTKNLVIIGAGALLLGALMLPSITHAQFQPGVLPSNLGLEYGTSIGLGTQDIRTTIANILNVAMGLLGIIAVVIILWGGFQWMVSGGDDTKVKNAKNRIIQGVVGLVIIITAYAIANFVITSLLQATSNQ